jgi:hypothetical protein
LVRSSSSIEKSVGEGVLAEAAARGVCAATGEAFTVSCATFAVRLGVAAGVAIAVEVAVAVGVLAVATIAEVVPAVVGLSVAEGFAAGRLAAGRPGAVRAAAGTEAEARLLPANEARLIVPSALRTT